MRKAFIGLIVAVSLSNSLVSCKKDSDVPAEKAAMQNADIRKIADNYYEQYLQFYPLEATAQGDKRYNNLLPNNISASFISEEIAFYNSTRKQLKAIDYQRLDDDSKVIYDVLDNQLKDKIERYAYHPQQIPFTQFGGLPLELPVLGSGQGSQPFETEEDYQNWLNRMEAFPEWMNTAIENFREGMKAGRVLPKKLVVRMIDQMRAPEIVTEDMERNIFFGPIRKIPSDFTPLQKNKYNQLYRAAIANSIITSYNKMADFLEEEYLPAARNSDGYNALPGGEEAYNYYVRSWTTTKRTPAEIHKTGLEEVTRIRKEMEKVKTQVGFNGTLEEFLEFVRTDNKAMPYSTAKQITDAFHAILEKIEPRLSTMFSHTPKTGFEIRQTEKFREASASAEYIPGTPDGSRNGIFYIPIPDPKSFNVTGGMESLFLHEAIPGHHYQISLQQENTSLPKFMRFGWIGAYGEGWALYTESLGPELGLYIDPYQKLGALSDEMLRAVRLVIDTGIHTGQMTREQAIAYFLGNVAYDEAGATAEVERYMAMPGQALSYKIGSMKIASLRAKYTKQLGSKFSLAGFHDAVLSQGCLPLDVLERKMDNWSKKQ